MLLNVSNMFLRPCSEELAFSFTDYLDRDKKWIGYELRLKARCNQPNALSRRDHSSLITLA